MKPKLPNSAKRSEASHVIARRVSGMPRNLAYAPTNGSAKLEEGAQGLGLPLKLTDHSGRTRRGRVILLPRSGDAAANLQPASGEEFRILILAEPPEDPLVPPEGVVICAPARPLAGKVSPRPPTSKRARLSALPLTSLDLEALRQGHLFTRAPLQVTAEELFAGGRARLAILARDLLLSQALSECLNAIAIALAAPGPARPVEIERLQELRGLLEVSGGGHFPREAAEAEAAIANVTELTSTAGPEELLACAERLYPNKQALMEDIYLLRSLQQSPEEAAELLALRRFLSGAPVPAEWEELAADRALLTGELTFAALAAEPQRFPFARAALERFRCRYIKAYREQHTRYWGEMANLHAALSEERAHAEALRRLNTLTDLGPPMGSGAIAMFEELLAETSGCPSSAGAEDAAAAEGGCPACRLSLDQAPPTGRVEQVIARIERASDKQVARLTSHAARLIVRGRCDGRLPQLLPLLQGKCAGLLDILDGEVLAYLRTVLSTETGPLPEAGALGAPPPEAGDDLSPAPS